MRGSRILLGTALVATMLLAVPSAAIGNGPDVSGTVTLVDGTPLAGVEVFLFDVGDLTAKFTCTDESGDYAFDAVVGFVPIMATGPEVFPADSCSNPKFYLLEAGPFNDRGRATPLVASFAFGVGDPPAVVDFVVEELPTESRLLFNLARQATDACYDRENLKQLTHFTDAYWETFDEVFDSLSEEARELYTTLGVNHLDFWLSEGNCPPGS